MTTTMPSLLAIFGLPGGGEWIILLVLGLLIFGRRLPEVGRSIGRSIVEFKKGIKGIEDDIEDETSRASRSLGGAEQAQLEGGPGETPEHRTAETSKSEAAG